MSGAWLSWMRRGDTKFGGRKRENAGKAENGLDRDLWQVYRAIHARISSRETNRSLKTILFTASYPDEGCSTVSSNLAFCLARIERAKVLLLELSGGVENSLIRAPRDVGLNQVISGEVALGEAIQPMGSSGLNFLARGSDGAKTVYNHEIDSVLSQLKAEFPYLIIDGPPVSNALDFANLLPQADGVVLVVEANRSRRQAVATSLKLLQDSGACVLGAVLNKRQYFIPDWLYGRL